MRRDAAFLLPQEARLASLALLLGAETAELRLAARSLPPERLLLLAAAAMSVSEAATLLTEAAAAAVERVRGLPVESPSQPEADSHGR